jgi:RNA 2',3'-cyclic 3'-phosphodiesterase
MRTFIAIELPEETRDALSRMGSQLCKNGMNGSWVKPENMHLTLRFYGDIEADAALRLGAFLGEALTPQIQLTLLARGIGAFPSIRKPSIIWAGLEHISGDLISLQRATERAAGEIGLPPETRIFHPHVTLVRLRRPPVGNEWAALLAPFQAENSIPEFGQEFRVRNVVLFSSTLTLQGPIYRKIREFPLQ